MNMEFYKGILFLRTNSLIDNNLGENIKLLVQDMGIKLLVLNISKLKRLDLEHLMMIFNCYKTIKSYHGRLYICEDKDSSFISLFQNKIPIINNELEVYIYE